MDENYIQLVFPFITYNHLNKNLDIYTRQNYVESCYEEPEGELIIWSENSEDGTFEVRTKDSWNVYPSKEITYKELGWQL